MLGEGDSTDLYTVIWTPNVGNVWPGNIEKRFKIVITLHIFRFPLTLSP